MDDSAPGHRARAAPAAGAALLAAYAATIFLSSFLLFQVQPIVAKIILPWFGGSAAVWTTCMLFFQVLLLLGYLYAFALGHIRRPAVQAVVHGLLLAATLRVLPLHPDPVWKPLHGEDPTLQILGLLTTSVGLPYFLLATSGPLLQAWYVREGRAVVPYRLFALSNLGSMLALLGYPVLVEPLAPTRSQRLGWSAGFLLFLALCGALAWRSRRHPAPSLESAVDAAPVNPRPALWLLWTALAACPSVLLLAVTSHLTEDVAPAPFLWLVPLSLYLLSFILTFEREGWYRRWLFVPLMGAGLGAMAILLETGHAGRLSIQVAAFSAALFAASMVCHGELARLKPHPRHLTSFYLCLSLGGALGGIFVGLAAPRLFAARHELPIGMAAAWLLTLVLLGRDLGRKWGRSRLAVVFAALGLSMVGLGGLLTWRAMDEARDSRVRARNFYGALRVRESGEDEDAVRTLLHGSISHGEQYLEPSRRRWITSYYAPVSGVGLAIEQSRGEGPQKVGVVGLGAGTLAAYGRKGDAYRFYEINPLILRLARTEFTFLSDCEAEVEVVMGDARLSLEGEAPQGFDVLAVDAFSGDSIPIHLLTREAFAQYFRHLRPGGLLAVHVSNRYLDLAPVVALASRVAGRAARIVVNEEDEDMGVSSSDWVLVGRAERRSIGRCCARRRARSRISRPGAVDRRLQQPLPHPEVSVRAGGREHEVGLVLEEGLLLHHLEPVGPGRREEVLSRHLVLDGRPYRHLALVEVDVGDASAGPEPRRQAPQVGHAVGKVVEGVDDQHHVAGGGRQQRVVGPRQDRRDVGRPRALQPLPQDGDDLRLHVHGPDAPPWPDGPRQAQREVAGPGADVAGHVPGPQAQCRHDLVRPLPGGPPRVLHPSDVAPEVLRVPVPAVAVALAAAAAVVVGRREECHEGSGQGVQGATSGPLSAPAPLRR
jgi:SAM-dependent methyltransferase